MKPARRKTAEELRVEGLEEYEKGNYQKAIKAFEDLKDWYPFSKHAALAELKIADAYFHMEEYEDAVFAYEEFETLHPRNEKTPYAVYQIAKCYFIQVDSVDRDQIRRRRRGWIPITVLSNIIRIVFLCPRPLRKEISASRVWREMSCMWRFFYYKTGSYKACSAPLPILDFQLSGCRDAQGSIGTYPVVRRSPPENGIGK